MSRHHHDDASSISSCSSSGSSRTSSSSSSAASSRSGSSRKSRSSVVSHSHIKGDHWVVSFMKWTTGAPLGEPLSLRKTKVHDSKEDWAYDDSTTVYSDSSYTQYAWVTPRWDDRVAVIAGRSDSRVSRRSMKTEPARAPPTFAPSHYQQPRFFPAQQPPPPPPPPIVPPPGPMYDDGETYDEYGESFHHRPPPPPPTNIGTADSAPFIILDGAGGSHPPGKYDDWAD